MRRAALLLIALLLVFGGPSIQAQNDVTSVVERYLNAWNAGNYAEMYRYVHDNSREQYPEPVFNTRLQDVHDTIGLESLTYDILDVKLQGESAAVTYDVFFETSLFGSLPEYDRLMRLMRTDAGWRIAWSTMDIFDGLTADSQLRVQALTGQRANLYDRNGNPITNNNGTTVALYGSQDTMGNITGCRNLLGEVLQTSVIEIDQTFNLYNSDTIFLLGEITSDLYAQYRGQLDTTCGATAATSLPHRTYYGGRAMVHVAGYIGPVQADEEDQYRDRGPGALIGRVGAEQAYDDYLAGRPANALRIVEPGGIVIREIASTAGLGAIPVGLTIDRDLQYQTAQALVDAYNWAAPTWGGINISPGGAAVVLDVNTGEILALTSYPLFNPSLFSSNSAMTAQDRLDALGDLLSDSRRPLENRAIQNQFAPGSVFKIITAAALLNEGKVAPNDTFECTLYWDGRPVGDSRTSREDWRVVSGEEAAGWITPAQALMASCNPFFWQYGAELYNEGKTNAVIEYARMMGLGRSYNLGIAQVEVAGSLPLPAGVEDAINESIGQGTIALPPIQMAIAAMAIANGGTVYEPYILKQIGGYDGTAVVETSEPVVQNTLDWQPFVIETVREGMCGVIADTEVGTAWETFATANYTACGKTGTAETGRYPNAWFISFAPADNPQIATVVMVEQSVGGSSVAAPITRRILDSYFGQSYDDYLYPDWWAEGPFEPPDAPLGTAPNT